MNIELWHLILLLLAFFGACAGFFKVVLAQMQREQDERLRALSESIKSNHVHLAARLDGIESTAREDAQHWQRLEREVLNLKAELPLHYVRRDDFVQAIGSISTRIDNFALRVERALDKLHGGHSQ